MSKNLGLAANVERYVTEEITRETKIQKRLREETGRMPKSLMQTTPDQVAFLYMLVRMTSARRILEIGTFTGYSALAMASALPDNGILIACDVSKEWTDIARRYWKEAGVDGRIDLRLAPAQETLAKLLAEGHAGTFDLVFIDADKPGYDHYYEASLKLLKTGGVIAIDNMLWSGAVADPSQQDANTIALHRLNLKIRNDERVDACLLTVADGLMLVRKRF